MAGPQFPIISNANPFTGGTAYGGGGDRLGDRGPGPLMAAVPEPFFRDNLDMQRSMYRCIPEAEYPDGYLGTIRSRRDDRLLRSVQERINERQYQRGVHKGERIDPGDYFWPKDFHPTLGLELEAQGRKFAPLQTVAERYMVLTQQAIPRGSKMLIEVNPERQRVLERLLPSWR